MPQIGQYMTGAFGQGYYWDGTSWVAGSQWDAQQFLAHYQSQLERAISKRLTFGGGGVGQYVPPALDPNQTQVGGGIASASQQITKEAPEPRINPISSGGFPIWAIVLLVLGAILIVPNLLKR